MVSDLLFGLLLRVGWVDSGDCWFVVVVLRVFCFKLFSCLRLCSNNVYSVVCEFVRWWDLLVARAWFVTIVNSVVVLHFRWSRHLLFY